jgi:ubiquinone/menaquinone biosynthesis C-methylase UbiE
MNSTNVWKTELYDNKLAFVSDFGKEVVQLLHPKPGEAILDLGCGTGELAYEIAQLGANVKGMDLSPEMIARARSKYEHIPFLIGNADSFELDEKFDAVFSNAALHWVKNAEQSLRCIRDVLNNGGRFVAEFGGKGNVGTITNAIHQVLDEEYGIDGGQLSPWYFPSIAEYSTLLERQGFRVTYAAHFDRPTKMKDGEDGLSHWLSGFTDDFFRELIDVDRRVIFKSIAEKVRGKLFQNGNWYVDYKRIRISAIKA